MPVKKIFKKPLPKAEPIREERMTAAEEPKATVAEDVFQSLIEVKRCACGEPVAPGQNYVCWNHQRSN